MVTIRIMACALGIFRNYPIRADDGYVFFRLILRTNLAENGGRSNMARNGAASPLREENMYDAAIISALAIIATGFAVVVAMFVLLSSPAIGSNLRTMLDKNAPVPDAGLAKGLHHQTQRITVLRQQRITVLRQVMSQNAEDSDIARRALTQDIREINERVALVHSVLDRLAPGTSAAADAVRATGPKQIHRTASDT